MIAQYYIDHPPNWMQMTLMKANAKLGTSSIETQSTIYSPKPSFIPLQANLGSFKMQIFDTTNQNNNHLLDVNVKGLDVALNQDLNLNLIADVIFNPQDVNSLTTFVTTFSNEMSSFLAKSSNTSSAATSRASSQSMYISWNSKVSVFGFLPIYNALPLHKSVDMNAMMMYMMNPTEANRVSAGIPVMNIATKKIQMAIPDQIILPPPIPPVALTNVTSGLGSGSAVKFSFDATFMNPTGLTASNIRSTNVTIGMGGVPVLNTFIGPVSLSEGLQTERIESTSTVMASNIMPQITSMIFGTSAGAASGLSIMGPIDVQPLTIVKQITKNVNFVIPSNSMNLMQILTTGNNTQNLGRIVMSAAGGLFPNMSIASALNSTGIFSNLNLPSIFPNVSLPSIFSLPNVTGLRNTLSSLNNQMSSSVPGLASIEKSMGF
jgi:hypothetical protein